MLFLMFIQFQWPSVLVASTMYIVFPTVCACDVIDYSSFFVSGLGPAFRVYQQWC